MAGGVSDNAAVGSDGSANANESSLQSTAPPIAVAVAAAAGVGAAIATASSFVKTATSVDSPATGTQRAPAFEAHVSQAQVHETPAAKPPVTPANDGVAATPVTTSVSPDAIASAAAPVAAAPVAAAPVVIAAQVIVPAATERPAVTAVAPVQAQEPAPAPAKDLNDVVAGAGLQWVQTVEPAQAYVPKPAAPRVPRVRKAKPVFDNTPLSQIETDGNKE